MSDTTVRRSLLERIPVIRGWVNRWRNRTAKNQLTNAYGFYSRAIKQAAIAEIRFDANGCLYTLEDGRRYRFDPSRAAGWLYSVPFTGVFENKETEYLKGILRQGWTCFDVGACFGWYSVIFSQAVGPTGKVYAFEPVTPNFECLRENARLNETDNVVLEDLALGDQPGNLQLYLPREGVSASFRPHGGAAHCDVVHAKVTTMDHYVREKGIMRVDFVKADIEGAELLFLKGGADVIERFKPMFLLEVQAHSTRLFGHGPGEVFRFLEHRGYRAYRIGEDGSLENVTAAGSSSLPDYNFLFKHSGRNS